MNNYSPYFWAKTTPEGKPGCSVREHGLATGEVARLLLDLLPESFRSTLPEGIPTLAALHDIGKISPGFQTQCPQWRGPYGKSDDATLYQWQKHNTSHAPISQSIIEEHGKTKTGKRRPWKAWAECVGAHHGRYPSTRAQSYPSWNDYTTQLIDEMEHLLGPLPSQALPPHSDALQEWLIGLIEVADWIASNESFFPAGGGLADPDIPAVAHRALRNIGFSHEQPVAPGKCWAELFPHAPTPRPVQQHLWEQAPLPGTYIVEDSMGGGKTEAALGLAYHLMEAGVADGLYFALPTQTTSNRIFVRVADFLQRAGANVSEQSLRLAHGNSWLMQGDLYQGWNRNESQSCARNWFASSRRALLARFGIGTIDQALMGELDVKHSFVRRFALSGKVVILDEVHSYDMYTGSLLDKLVHKLRKLGASVIILSATLTRPRIRTLLELSEQEGNFSAYPLVSSKAQQSHVRETPLPAERERSIQLSYRILTEQETVRLACERATAGQCVLWIRNTVAEAQEAYRQLCAERCEDGPELGLLHARFPLWRRQQLEEEWIGRLGRDRSNRPCGCVLVATQVAEQSLDIDADYLITDLAPTDMLLQRAGRLWRHERPLTERPAKAAEMLIRAAALTPESTEQQLIEALGPSAHVYAPYVLIRSHELWQNRSNLQLPADIRPLLEATYAERTEAADSAMACLLHSLNKKKAAMAQLAHINSAKGVCTRDDRDDISTRYDTRPQLDVLLLTREPEQLTATARRCTPLHGEPFTIDDAHWDFRAARAIQENLVHLPLTPSLKALLQNENAHTIRQYGFSPLLATYPLDMASPGCYLHGVGWTPELGVYLSQPTPPLYPHDAEE